MYTIPVSFGNRLDNSLWSATVEAIVDTGCSTTTLDVSVLDWIKSKYEYNTKLEYIDVVNSRAGLNTGYIDVCSVPHSGVKVHYANLNGRTALIGTDLLNSGKLDIDCGTRVSFTRH